MQNNEQTINNNSVETVKSNNDASKTNQIEAKNPINKFIDLIPKVIVNNVKIIKKDGTKEDYDIQKVVAAVKKSAARMLVDFTDKELETICNLVNRSVLELRKPEVEIIKMHY
ncbi:MAG: ATP cone domain-containing protein, partial [Candidatus Gastranaerophilaceae bacterium]